MVPAPCPLTAGAVACEGGGPRGDRGAAGSLAEACSPCGGSEAAAAGAGAVCREHRQGAGGPVAPVPEAGAGCQGRGKGGPGGAGEVRRAGPLGPQRAWGVALQRKLRRPAVETSRPPETAGPPGLLHATQRPGCHGRSSGARLQHPPPNRRPHHAGPQGLVDRSQDPAGGPRAHRNRGLLGEGSSAQGRLRILVRLRDGLQEGRLPS
mmetsp:Transcript_104245/g.336190  ORF Transcript_104245/g.336190 Transcript_104245/m.336190 type:complete len:208 (-) Transcript_104245:521-1144(-)